MATISRRTARESAVKALYSYEFNADLQMDAAEFFALICSEAEIPTNDFAVSLYTGTIAHMEEIDEKIAENAKGWKKERISAVSKAVLTLATYEMLFFDDIPVKVSINEAIELAKKYMRSKEVTKENLAKCYRYLLSKGFSYESAQNAIKSIKDVDDDY